MHKTVGKGNVYACQFHPEKSGFVGQEILRSFLAGSDDSIHTFETNQEVSQTLNNHTKGLSRRVIACLDVRANDNGDLVVTKVGFCKHWCFQLCMRQSMVFMPPWQLLRLCPMQMK